MSIVYFNECSETIFYDRAQMPSFPFLLPDVHCHANYEILYVISGRILHFTDYGTFNIGPGEISLVPPFVKHQSYHEANTERIVISFFRSHINNSDNQILNCFHTPHIQNAKHLFPILEEIGKEYKRADQSSVYAVEYYTSLLLIYLTRITANNPVTEVNPSMEEIKNYITEHYMFDIPLEDIAEKYGMSKYYFSRKFKNYAGIGFQEFITLVRIQNAERMLVTTSESISKVAAMCGFNDSSYFTQTFKRYKGVTPKQYRKM